MRVCVIGTGHVGLVTAVALAHLGHEVVGLDSDPERVATLRAGRAPFFEPGLDHLLAAGLASGRVAFTDDAAAAVPGAEVCFICVGTPPKASGQASLVAVERATRAVAHHATGPAVVVEKSTVPAGTAWRITRTIANERPELAGLLHVASNPEFLREGRAIEDTLSPDRILVGVEDAWAAARLRELYRPLTEQGYPYFETTIATAEIAKHACNAFLAMKISFANALARICEAAGADVTDVTAVMGADPRINPHFLAAGLGYGGFCFPKDVQAFERLAGELGYDFALLRAVAAANDDALHAVFAKIEHALWNLEDKRIALLGVAFKPDTDDVRFSPALRLAELLLAAGAEVVAYDPAALPNALAEQPALRSAPDPYAAAAGAHCVVLCTEWGELARLDLARLRAAVAYPILIDARNLLDPDEVVAAGFTVHGVGRPPREAAPPVEAFRREVDGTAVGAARMRLR